MNPKTIIFALLLALATSTVTVTMVRNDDDSSSSAKWLVDAINEYCGRSGWIIKWSGPKTEIPVKQCPPRDAISTSTLCFTFDTEPDYGYASATIDCRYNLPQPKFFRAHQVDSI